MRKLRRPPVTPPTLTGEGKGARLARDHATKKRADAAVELTFPDHWNEPDVRGPLYAMHGRVCAYCQCYLPHNDPGDVEHFRPKSRYWWLAYEFVNYLLSCAACNRNRKKEKFPLASGTPACAWEDRHNLHAERFLLLDPVLDDVEAWVQVDHGAPLCPVEPRAGLVPGSEPWERADTTIRFFKLNENGRLIQQRKDTINRALRAIPQARAGDLLKAEEIREMASRYRPHGIAVRQMLAELAPELLPPPEDDLVGLILDFHRDLTVADQVLAKSPKSDLARTLRAEVLWALAVLWKHPPAGDGDFVAACLDKVGRRGEVESFAQKL
jgi:uncharacterized protein (TIGR02646 family)